MQLRLKLDRAEAGETFSSFSGAISVTPGDLNPANTKCIFSAVAPYVDLVDQAYVSANSFSGLFGFDPFVSSCVVPSNTILYMNFTPSGVGAEQCGGSSICRTQIIN